MRRAVLALVALLGACGGMSEPSHVESNYTEASTVPVAIDAPATFHATEALAACRAADEFVSGSCTIEGHAELVRQYQDGNGWRCVALPSVGDDAPRRMLTAHVVCHAAP